ncbi:unnamed protein product [Symbiodinium sp. CCMP2592]|nr:unnamed protein product [Symbiodinium sp. CCMP2592]
MVFRTCSLTLGPSPGDGQELPYPSVLFVLEGVCSLSCKTSCWQVSAGGIASIAEATAAISAVDTTRVWLCTIPSASGGRLRLFAGTGPGHSSQRPTRRWCEGRLKDAV